MTTNLVNIQLTGKGANIKNEPNDIDIKVPPDVKKEQKQNQPNTFNKKKKKQKINNFQNFNNATPALFVAPHHGLNYFVPPNLAQNLGGPSLYTMPGMHQNMMGQNAALKPNQKQPLARKKAARMLLMRHEIQQAVAVADRADKERIAWEMSLVDRMDSDLKKYKEIGVIHNSILRKTKPARNKLKLIQQIEKAAAKANQTEKERIAREMNNIQRMNFSRQLQHLAILHQSIINNKSKKSVNPALQKPVVITLTAETKDEDFTQDIVTPAQSLQQQHNQSHVVNPSISDITRRGARNNKKKNTVIQNVQVFKPGSSTSQFQAPHQDEPEDLSDDLAPHMGQGQQQPATQTLPLTAENKLNFKFQRTTQTKTPDWSEYQNKFKRIGGASPDHEDEGSQEVKQEPNKDQSINTGPNNLRIQIPPISQQTVTATQQKRAGTPKVELKTTQLKSTEIPLKPIDVRVRNATPGYTLPQPTPNIHSNTHLPNMGKAYENYPKGIPKSFLPKENNPVAPLPIPGCSFPAGIPRSFLKQEQLRLQEMSQPTPLQIPDPNFQTQPAYMDLPSWILPSQPPEPPQHIHEHLSPNVPPMLPFVHQERVERPYSPTDVYSEGQRGDDGK
ncbi:uncharacterized protein LOC134671565 [Cydia fagiglandana]|uniref:uncharacterized protein LOC134671565 n=1 Tax=Cydia fagiglandana TaxID=1458189 RepID=UPI002FEE5AF2